MAQSATRTNSWDGKWEPFSSKLDEWLFFKDELDSKKVNDPLLKLTKHEIAEQVLHDIEDLGKNTNDDWLDDFPLFEEIQTPADNFDGDVENEGKPENCALKFETEQFSSNVVGLVASGIQQQPLADKDLFSVSNENAATFVLSNENVLFINNEPFLTLIPANPNPPAEAKNNRSETPTKKSENENSKNSENVNVEPELSCLYLDTPDVKMEMAVVDEIIRNTALELDQWESDSSRSETSWDGTSASDMSPKGKEEEMDDPDWKPDALDSGGRKCSNKKCKPYSRGGGQEEKKLRKKEQNKNAATRYRQKKKAEVKEILKEEELLKEKKASLEEKVADIQSEIKYLKKLMRDLFKAKGLIN